MLRQLTALAVVGLLLVTVRPVRADDQEKIQGVWRAEKGVKGGKEGPADEIKQLSLEFKGNKVIPRHGDQGDHEGEFKLDTTKKPKEIDLMIDKNGKKDHAKGIYELDGDTLKICLMDGDGDRPSKFESADGSKSLLIVLKREKK